MFRKPYWSLSTQEKYKRRQLMWPGRIFEVIIAYYFFEFWLASLISLILIASEIAISYSLKKRLEKEQK